jgi:hypothetical protein
MLWPRCFNAALTAAVLIATPAKPAGLERVRYNHPGLAVDLGVGLWSAPVPCDADDDGDFDLIVVCHDKPYQGTYLFENHTGDTTRHKLPVFKPARRLGRGLENCLPSYVDGQLRVLTPSREHPEFLKIGLDGGVALPLPWSAHPEPAAVRTRPFKLRGSQWRYLDFDGDARLDLINGVGNWSEYGWDNAYDSTGRWTNGPLHGYVFVLRNTNTNTTATPAYDRPLQLTTTDGRALDVFGNVSPNFADFDGDGDLDLLCGEFLDGFNYFENVGTRTLPRYAAGRSVNQPDGQRCAMDLEMIVPVAFDWDKDGDLDLIVGDEDGRVAFVENTGRLDRRRTPVFRAPRYFQQEADILKCGALATPVGVDWDADGDLDIVSGNTAGYIEFFENLSGPRVAVPKWAAPQRLKAGGEIFRIMAGPNRSIQGPAEAKWGYTTLNVADWNLDGRLDIVLNSILGDVMWLKNVGTKTRPRLASPEPIDVEWETAQPVLEWGWRRPEGQALLTQWRTTPLVFDFNQDGLPDLAMLDQEGYLAFFERARQGRRLILKHPRRVFVNEQGEPLRLATKRAGGSGRRKLCVTDWDGDGRFDLLLNSANANLLRQVASKDGQWFFKDEGPLNTQNIEGHDVSPAVVDFDGNGVPDFLGGAEDGHFYWMANGRSRNE